MQTDHNQRDLGRETERERGERGEFVPYRPVGGGSSGVIGKGSGTAGSRRREPWQREPSHHGEEAAGGRAAGTAGQRGHRMGRGAPGARQGLGAPLPLPPALWGGCWARQAHGSFPKATQARQACGDSSEPGSRRRNGFPTVSSPAAALPTLPRTQAAPQSPGDGDRCPPQPPRGCGTPKQQPQRRARVSLPHPAPPGVVGPPTMGFVGLFRAPDKGPEQPCEVSFLSLPQGARHNGRGGRDSPGPSPPSSPFPPQTPKDKIVGLSSEASSEAGCKEGFSSWDRRSPAHPLLKNPKIFQLAGLKTQKNTTSETRAQGAARHRPQSCHRQVP